MSSDYQPTPPHMTQGWWSRKGEIILILYILHAKPEKDWFVLQMHSCIGQCETALRWDLGNSTRILTITYISPCFAHVWHRGNNFEVVSVPYIIIKLGSGLPISVKPSGYRLVTSHDQWVTIFSILDNTLCIPLNPLTCRTHTHAGHTHARTHTHGKI